MRRSGYAKMSLQAEHGKVEEHKPIKPHLRVEMSPLPTPLNRQARIRARHTLDWHGKCGLDM